MQGLMMDMPLMISSIIRYAAEYHGSTPIVARTIEGELFRYDYRSAYARIQRLAHAIERLGMAPGDRVATLAWNTHRHFEMFYGVTGTGAVLHTVNPRLYPSSSSTSSTTPRTGCCSSMAPRCRSPSRSHRGSRPCRAT